MYFIKVYNGSVGLAPLISRAQFIVERGVFQMCYYFINPFINTYTFCNIYIIVPAFSHVDKVMS